MLGLTQLVADPQYDISPKRLLNELLKGQRIDPKRVQYTEQERAEMAQKSNPVEDAKAELIKAQTGKTQAETATKNVEGMFSATSAGNLIAQNPAIAPVADQIWLVSRRARR